MMSVDPNAAIAGAVDTVGLAGDAPGNATRDLQVSALLATLTQWAESGWLRRLDAALARFVAELSPAAAPQVLLATALVAHQEGRGHTCLPLEELLAAPDELLGWDTQARDALHQALASQPDHIEAWLQSLKDCAAVWQPEIDADRGQPLVLSGRRLYLRRYWDYESRVVAQVQTRTAGLEPVDEAVARHWLDRLFDPLPGAAVAPPQGIRAPDDAATLPLAVSKQAAAPDWQKIACAVALRGRLSVITGGPGTGKTYTAARLLALLFAVAPDHTRLRVALAAPTGKAAARLKQSIDSALQGLQQRVGAELDIAELARRVGAAHTLHSLLGARPDTRRLRHDAAHPLEVDVLIVDEASMVHLEMMAALLDALPPSARVVLLGDKDQLASVEAGAVLGDLCRDAQAGRYRTETLRQVERLTGQQLPDEFADEAGPALAQHTVMLRKSQRFGGLIGQLAEAVNQGDARRATVVLGSESSSGAASMHGVDRDGVGDGEAVGTADPTHAAGISHPAVHPQPVAWLAHATPAEVLDLAAHGRAGAEGGYRRYLGLLRQRPADPAAQDGWVRTVMTAFDSFRVLCALREGEWGVSGLNRAIELRLAAEQWLTPRGEWYAGRPVIVTRNDASLGVFNGDVGLTLPAAPGSAALRAWFVDGEAVRSVSVSRLADVQTAFAMTVHKSQGSEFDHTVLVLPPHGGPVLSRELVYTGITRARSALTLVTGRPEALAQAVGRSTRRSSGLRARLEGA